MMKKSSRTCKCGEVFDSRGRLLQHCHLQGDVYRLIKGQRGFGTSDPQHQPLTKE